MKKIVFILAVAIIVSSPLLKAGEPVHRNEISAGYGRVTFIDFAQVTASIFATIFTAGYASYDNFYSWGSLSLEYHRTLGSTFTVGVALSCYGGGADQVDRDTKEWVADVKYRGISIMPSAKAFWFRKTNWAMYSKLGLGLSLLDEYDEEHSLDPYYAAQLSPIAVEAGGDQWRGYLELGAGMQGIVVAGVHFSF